MQRSGLVILLYSLILCGCITGVSEVSGQTQKTDASRIKKEKGTAKKAKKESGGLRPIYFIVTTLAALLF